MAFFGKKEVLFSLLRFHFCLENSVSSCPILRQIHMLKLLKSVSKILSRNFSKYIWNFVLPFKSRDLRHLHVSGELCSTIDIMLIPPNPTNSPSLFFCRFRRMTKNRFYGKILNVAISSYVIPHFCMGIKCPKRGGGGVNSEIITWCRVMV